MITTIVLLTFLTLFIAYEFIAHFVFKNKNLETASFVIRAFDKGRPWAKGLITLILIAAWMHLVLQWF